MNRNPASRSPARARPPTGSLGTRPMRLIGSTLESRSRIADAERRNIDIDPSLRRRFGAAASGVRVPIPDFDPAHVVGSGFDGLPRGLDDPHGPLRGVQASHRVNLGPGDRFDRQAFR